MKIKIYYNYGKMKGPSLMLILFGIFFFTMFLFFRLEDLFVGIIFGILFIIAGIVTYRQHNKEYNQIIECERFEVIQ